MRLIELPKNELRGLYEKKKLTTHEIADIYNCCQATIWKRLKEYGIKCFPSGRRFLNIPRSRLKNLYINQRLSSRKIAKLYQCAYSAIDNKIKKYDFSRRNLAESHVIYPRKNFNGNLANKAYLIGFAMGDLRVRKRSLNSETINIDCGSTKKEQIDLIARLFKSYGRVWISKPNKRGATQVECLLNESFNFLLKKRNLIDPWILRKNQYFWAFLAGFTDAEGCIAISNNRAYYSLGNYNKNLLTQIRNYLIQDKIYCSKLIESKTKGKLCFNKYFHNQNYWQFQIHKKDSLLTLFRLIGSYLKHSKKRGDMKRAKQNIILRNRKFN